MGLALLDQAVTRLLNAHEVVVEEDPEAYGLQVIESFTVESDGLLEVPKTCAPPGSTLARRWSS